jgi:hypothetical protein
MLALAAENQTERCLPTGAPLVLVELAEIQFHLALVRGTELPGLQRARVRLG